jgi:hypothetical protein
MLVAMLIYSMSVSVDGFITDRDGAFDWSGPSDEQFRFQAKAKARRVDGAVCACIGRVAEAPSCVDA